MEVSTKSRIEDQLRSRVEDGAELLDQQFPDWEVVVRIRDLAMHNPCNCILGQLYGDYLAANTMAEELDVDLRNLETSYGFDHDPDLPEPEHRQYEILQSVWAEQIRERRQTKSVVA